MTRRRLDTNIGGGSVVWWKCACVLRVVLYLWMAWRSLSANARCAAVYRAFAERRTLYGWRTHVGRRINFPV